MKLRPLILFLLGSFFLSPIVSPETQSAESSPILYLGRAKIEITPQIGTPLAGYGRRKGRPSTSVHDPLYARAIVLHQGVEKVVFVTADLVLIDAELREAVLKKIRLRMPLEKANLILSATHNHSGAGAIGGRFWERFIMGRHRKKVFEELTSKIAEAALEASRNLVRVEIEYGETDIQSLVENRMDERIHTPKKLKVLRFTLKHSAKGMEHRVSDASSHSSKTERPYARGSMPYADSRLVLAHLIFMSAHPTLFSERYAFSADFPGQLAHFLEETYPESTSLFINGAAADLRPHTASFSNSPDRVKAYGFALSEEVKKMKYSPVSLNQPWRLVWLKTRLPRVQAKAGFVKIPSLLGGRIFPRHSYLQGARLGPFVFLTFPGELASEIGEEIESRVKAYHLKPLIVGYANDYIGYVIPERHYHHSDHYESRASFYGSQMDWFVQRKMGWVLEHLISSEEKTFLEAKGKRSEHQGLPVLHLEGDPYHRGFEEGRLLKKEIQAETAGVFKYLRDQLPIPFVDRLLIHKVLDNAWNKLRPYVSFNEFLELQGIAHGSKISLQKILRLHALPEVYPTWCTNGAYWGAATKDGRLIALRNLDWNREIGVHSYAAVKFHKMEGMKNYVNIGYAGFSGVLSGMNEAGISVGQIGSTSTDETMKGVPMYFLLKRILEKSGSLEDAKAIFSAYDLTRGYNYVIADAVKHKAMAVEATAHHVAFFKDDDPAEKSVVYALPLKNSVLRSDTALNPEIRDLQLCSKGDPKKPGLEPPGGSAHEIRYQKHAELIRKNYGQLDVGIVQKIAAEIAPKSNIQSVIYAFPEFYVANAKGNKKAAESGYRKFKIE